MQEAALPHGKLRGEEVKPPLRAALRAGQFSMAGRMDTFCAGGSGKRVFPRLLFVTMRPCKPE